MFALPTIIYKLTVLEGPNERLVNELKTKMFKCSKGLDFKSIFVKPLLLTNDTKLREFQYKYLIRIIPNNSFLLKCGLKPSNLCDFCCMTIDSNIHMFWDCTTIQTFWHDLKLYIETSIDYTYEKISFCNVLDGNLPILQTSTIVQNSRMTIKQ